MGFETPGILRACHADTISFELFFRPVDEVTKFSLVVRPGNGDLSSLIAEVVLHDPLISCIVDACNRCGDIRFQTFFVLIE